MRESKFLFQKLNGKFRLDRKDLFEAYLQSLKEGEKGEIIVHNIPKPKSGRQNRLYWYAIDRAVEEMTDLGIDSSYLYGHNAPTGVPITKDMLHQWVYAMFPQTDEAGNRITMSNSKWTSRHESQTIDALLNFLASQIGIVINVEEMI